MNALTCQKCWYNSRFPKADRKCNQGNTTKCKSGIKYCFTAKYTDSSGVVAVSRGCDVGAPDNVCPDAKKTCDDSKKKNNWTSCYGACCEKNNCNNYDPTSSATDIIVSKFALILMVIAGLLAS